MLTLMRNWVSRIFKAGEPPYVTTSVGGSVLRTQIARKYEAYAREGFHGNALVYGAIMVKARAVATAPRRAYSGEPQQPEWLPADHPLQFLLRKPNPFMSGTYLSVLESIFLNLSGNSYTLVLRDDAGVPTALYPMRPDRVQIVPTGTKSVMGYLYQPTPGTMQGAFPILREDMIHVKLPNAIDDLEGLGEGSSPILPSAAPVDVDNKLTSFLSGFMDAGVMPAGMLTHTAQLTDQQVESIKRRWRTQHGGYSNWSDILVVDSRVSYQRLGLTLNELSFDSLDERGEARLLAVFGVPPILIPTRFGLRRATYANYAQARKALWEDVMLFELNLFGDEYTSTLLADQPAAGIAHDISDVPALSENLRDRADTAKIFFDMGVPAAIALERAGIEIGTFPGSELPFAGTSSTPDPSEGEDPNQRESPAPVAREDEGETDPTEDDPNEERDDDAETLSAIRQIFRVDEQVVYEIFDRMQADARREKRSWKWHDAADDLQIYYTELAPAFWSTVVPAGGQVADHCRDVLLARLVTADRQNWTLAAMRKETNRIFRTWSSAWAVKLATDVSPVLTVEDGVVITEDDVTLAIQEARERVGDDLADLLEAKPYAKND